MVVEQVSQHNAHVATDEAIQWRQQACKATLLFSLLTSPAYLGDCGGLTLPKEEDHDKRRLHFSEEEEEEANGTRKRLRVDL